jgi:NAD(P)-dependent dehydrogenase (short-subunit alcohol dehydrogenase family)
MRLDLDGRAYLVTGGSRGIGLEIARGLAAEGARVAICGRDGDACAATARQLGDAVVGVSGDVSTPAGAAGVVEQAVAALGRLDGLVNNAGRFGGGPVAGLSRDLLEDPTSSSPTGSASTASSPATRAPALGSSGPRRWPPRTASPSRRHCARSSTPRA